MKLYTEEQIKGAHIKGILKGRAGTTIPSGDLADLYISELTPIELPSDEEIEKKSYKLFHQNDNIGKGTWIYGAIWIKELIVKQNK